MAERAAEVRLDSVRVWPLVGRDGEVTRLAELLTTGTSGGVLISGAAGVGKSRLTAELARLLARESTVHSLTGSAATRAVPLGAFASWIDGSAGPAGDPLQLVRRLIAAISASSGPPPVVVVDDAHLLDDMSAFVLAQLVVRRVARVIVTMRSGEHPPPTLTTLWKDRLLHRHDVCPLPLGAVRELVGVVLDGPVSAECVTKLYELSGGNVLFLRCLVEQELGAGRLAPAGGQWVWAGWVAASPTLAELVQSQLGEVSGELGELVDLLAVGGPTELAVLSDLVSADALERAEHVGLVQISGEAVPVVRLGHPLYGEARLVGCDADRAGRLRSLLAAACAQHRESSAIDPVRVAMLWLYSDLPRDQSVLAAGAAAAAQRMDAQLAECLAAACPALDSSPELAVLRAHMLVLLIRSQEAEQALAAVGSTALSDTDYADLILVRSANLLWPLANPAAVAKLTADPDPALGPAARNALRITRAIQLASDAKPQAALSVLAELDDAPLGDLPMVERCWAETLALGDLGRVDEMLESAECGLMISESSPKAAYQGVGLSEYIVTGCLNAGMIADAQAGAARIERRCADVPGIVSAVAAAISGLADLGVGQVDSAVERLSAAVADFVERGDTSGLVYRYRIALTEALARAGDLGGARSCEAMMHRARHPSFGYIESDALLASAWVAAAAGDLSSAGELAAQAAARAAGTGQSGREVLALQVAAGFGASNCVVRLAKLIDVVQGPRASVAGAYAAAADHGDGAAMLAVSAKFLALGDRLAAVDAAAIAARIFRAADLRPDEYRATGRARRLQAGTGYRSPLLQEAISALPLSDREWAVATMVVQGMSNKQIAEHLVTSVRTVEGHLYRSSSRIGVRSRDELAAIVREWAG